MTSPYHRHVLVLIIQSLVVISFISFQTLQTVKCQQISKNFADVIDAATSVYTSSKEWKDFLVKSNIYLPLPTCQKLEFPPKFNFTRNYMNLCYDLEAFEPWISIHETAGRLLLQTIKEKYNLPVLNPIYKKYPTGDGYFSTMKKGVDGGECDVIVGATNWNKDRLAQAHFQCKFIVETLEFKNRFLFGKSYTKNGMLCLGAYGNSYQGWLRSELQNDTVTINTISDLDNTGIIVVVSADTSYQDYVNANFKKATVKVIGGYDDAWALISNKTAHAYIADVLDLYIWVGNNRDKCAQCSVHIFGDPTNFGTFVTANIDSRTSGVVSTNGMQISMFVWCFMLIMSIVS